MHLRRFVFLGLAFAVLFLSSLSQVWACSGVTGVSPSSGPAAGGTTVTITGSGFNCATITVAFGSNPATSFTVLNDTTLTAVTPPGSGTVDVIVTIDSTPYPLAAAYTYASANTDSLNIKSLQGSVSSSVAGTSGQVMTGAVDGAIGDAFSDSGGGMVTPGPNGLTINFAAEPRTKSRTEEAFAALAYAGNIDKARTRAPLTIREWSAWADLRGTGFDRDDATNGTHGHQFNLTAGIGRKLTPDLLLGVFAGYETFKFTSSAMAGKVTGDGGTFGAYGAWRFAQAWRADAMLGWSRVGYDAVAGLASGSFTGSRWLASGGLTGSYRVGGFTVEPSTRIYALWERQDAWTDSLGAAQAARDFALGRFSAGGKAIYPWLSAGGTRLDPYVGLYADYRFSSDSALPVNAANTGISNGTSGRVVAGINSTMPSGLGLRLGGEYGGLGANYKIWTANARASMPF